MFARFSTPGCCKVGTQTCTECFTLAYSESSFALSFSGRAGTPFGQTSPCLLLGTYFFSFCQSCNLRLFTGTHPEFRGIAQRPSVVRSTFRCLVSLTLRHSARGLHATNLHPGSTPRACSFANQRLLRCIWGCNSAWREFVSGHGGCVLTKTASKQHRHCPKKDKISNILSVQHADPGCSK